MKKILIIDDEPILLSVFQRILDRLGYMADTAQSYNEAMKKFSDSSYDLIFIDVLMPEKTGFEIAREMRRLNRRQKIVLITGLDMYHEELVFNRKRSNVDGILFKPFTLDKVKESVESILNMRKKFNREMKPCFV